MNNPNPYQSPKADAIVRSSQAARSGNPTVESVLKWAMIGAGCGVTAVVLAIVMVYSRGRFADECDPALAGLAVMLFPIPLLLVGAVLGAIVGLFMRHRKRRDERDAMRNPQDEQL